MRTNPWLSLWLSGFNTVASTARAHALVNTQRYYAALLNEGARQWMRYWTLPVVAARPSRGSRSRRSR